MMIRPIEPRAAAFDLYDDLMAISSIEASITLRRRHNAPAVRDFTRLARYVPNLKV